MNRWTRWARWLRRRHSRRDVRRAAPGMALVRRAGPRLSIVALGGPRRTSVSLHVRPVLRVIASHPPAPAPTPLAVVRGPRMASVRARLASPAARSDGAAAAVSPIVPRPSPRFADVSLRRLVATTVERRVSRLDGPARRSTRGPATTARAAALPAEVRGRAARHERPAPEAARLISSRQAAPATPVTAPASAGAVATARALPSEPAGWPAAAPPAVDVNALTSQVIQQLDRRLVAYRERMGRV